MDTHHVQRYVQARTQAGLSQGQVARLLGLQCADIAALEGGELDLNEDQMKRFAEVYGVSPTWLGGGEVPAAGRDFEGSLRLAAREEGCVDAQELEDLIEFLRSVRS